MEKKEQFSIWHCLIAFLAIMAIQNFLFPPHTENLAYRDFKALVKVDKVDNIAVSERIQETGAFESAEAVAWN